MLIRRSWPGGLRGGRPNITVRLQPDGSIVEGEARGGQAPLGAVISIDGQSRDFVDRFAGSRSILVESRREVVYQIAIGSADRAVAAMRECETEALRQWGIDPAAFAAVSVPATGSLGRFFSDSDYPYRALSTNTSGFSIVRITVNVEGRISECAPVAGTRDEVLDQATCRILLNRGRLEPARDAGGAAISSQLVTSINWLIVH